MEEQPPSSPRNRPNLLPILLLPPLVWVLTRAFAQGDEIVAGVTGAQVATLAMLLLLSGLMSGSETALTALGEWKLRQLREEGQDPYGLFALLERNPTRFITTLLIGNNLVNIAATALVTQMSIQLSHQAGFSEAAAVAYATGIMTVLVLVFGEITPKSIAVHHPVGFARLVIRPVHALSVVLYPIGRAFAWFTTWVLRAFRLEPGSDPLITENELRLMLRSAEESGVIEASEQEMIRGIIDLEETVVREVMTPRVDVVAISEEASLHDLLAATTEHGYSRLPVYRESIDDVRGIVYARDLLRFLGSADDLATTRVADFMHPPQYVPETTSVLDLMRDMRLRKNHIAVVVDEFGGTAGLVTLEDIIEEITGEIYDETDEEEELEFDDLPDGSVRIRASVHLEEVEDRFRIDLGDEGEYDTLAGYLISELGRIPQVGESHEVAGLRFTVEDAEERRVILVRAERIGPLPDGAGIEPGAAEA
ncbi:MAG: hemolysin family protein [Trueperaceae bacterium]|nr:hemolysin family protein [Trueperaceae bacterium]